MSRTTRVTGITCFAMVFACGARTASPPTPRDPPTPVDAAVSHTPIPDAAVGPHVQLPTTKHKLIETPHGGTITQLAVTPDGKAAITLDDLGGFRLWPALDGSVEPRVTELPRPAQL